MSQTKAITQDLRDPKGDEGAAANRILTRRASRSAAAQAAAQAVANKQQASDSSATATAAAADDNDGSAPKGSMDKSTRNNSNSTNATTMSPPSVQQQEQQAPPTRMTRSQSTESSDSLSSSSEQQLVTSTTTRKRTRRGAGAGGDVNSTNTNNKKRAKSSAGAASNNGKDKNDRETRNTSQRMTKEAREARRAQRAAEAKERLAELNAIEEAVKNGTHPEYIRLLEEVEKKRDSRIHVTKVRYELSLKNHNEVFKTTCKASNDHFVFQKQACRRRMMQEVQQKISKLEQESYSHNITSSLDNQHVTDWTPRHRPSRLDFVVVPLTDEEADNDFDQMRTAIIAQQKQQKQNNHHHRSPPSTTPPPYPPQRYQHHPSLPQSPYQHYDKADNNNASVMSPSVAPVTYSSALPSSSISNSNEGWPSSTAAVAAITTTPPLPVTITTSLISPTLEATAPLHEHRHHRLPYQQHIHYPGRFINQENPNSSLVN